jgi:hypothetical protein
MTCCNGYGYCLAVANNRERPKRLAVFVAMAVAKAKLS